MGKASKINDTKICSKCNIRKAKSEFRRRKDRPCGLVARCKSCDQKYRQSPKGSSSLRKGAEKYRKTPKFKETLSRYRSSDIGRLKTRLSNKRYLLSDKGRLFMQQASRRRRERKYNLDLQLTKEDVKFVYERFDNQCFNCDSKENLHIDHHYPLSKGFGLSLENAVLLCTFCNSSKHDKMPEEFYTQEQLYILKAVFTNE